MINNDFQDLKLSALGMGAMRLPVINGDDSQIDENATRDMIAYAMDHGINYYDTAWGYHGGNSEKVMGKLLSEYPRENYYLATKFPGYDLSTMSNIEAIFEKQLEKCQVGYFDFYLFHNVCEMNIDAYLDPDLGLLDYLIKQKHEGWIHHLGFSTHGSLEVIKRFLDAYGRDMEFGQLQINWVDWTFQEGKAKIELLREYNIPVWVMEPLRGGKLAELHPDNEARLKALRPDETVPAWAFRFLQSIPEVKVVLSGMSNYEQMKDNILTYSTDVPLNENEMDILLEIADGLLDKTLPCTACNYCVSHCPQELPIPYLLSLYNEHSFTEGGFIAPMALMALPDDKLPNACTGCRSCEQVCPQQIKISEAMEDFSTKLQPKFEESK